MDTSEPAVNDERAGAVAASLGLATPSGRAAERSDPSAARTAERLAGRAARDGTRPSKGTGTRFLEIAALVGGAHAVAAQVGQGAPLSTLFPRLAVYVVIYVAVGASVSGALAGVEALRRNRREPRAEAAGRGDV